MESIAVIIVAIISIFGNVIQYLLNKKSNDIGNLVKQVELLSKLQDEQTKAYEREKKLQENDMVGLRKQVDEQDEKLKDNKDEILRLQRMISRLIGNGCHLQDCPNRSPYTVEEINEMTKNNKKNEKIYKQLKKQMEG